MKHTEDGFYERFRDEDPTAISDMASKIYWCLRRLGARHEDAEDLTQTALEKTWTKLGTYSERPGIGFAAWALQIARHLRVSFVRRENSPTYGGDFTQHLLESSESQCEGSSDAGPPEEAQKREEAERVNAALKTLSDCDQSVLISYYLHDLKIDEIAEAEGVPRGTIQSRLVRARERLRAVLSDCSDLEHDLHTNGKAESGEHQNRHAHNGENTRATSLRFVTTGTKPEFGFELRDGDTVLLVSVRSYGQEEQVGQRIGTLKKLIADRRAKTVAVEQGWKLVVLSRPVNGRRELAESPVLNSPQACDDLLNRLSQLDWPRLEVLAAK